MVKFRGIEMCIISQFDISRIPEFQYPKPYPTPADPFSDREGASATAMATATEFSACPTASCYVPIYPGSQIWFEYTVDGPHPPGAAYFFKLFLNGRPITAWDCTAKHGFHGKMMYNLVVDARERFAGGEVGVRRQALRFGDGPDDSRSHTSTSGAGVTGRVKDRSQEDVIQINVHRIEHRRRIRDLQHGLGSVDGNGSSKINSNGKHPDGLRLTDSGFLEPGFRPKRYQYQLLDPADLPYAAFRFYCRPYSYLQDHGTVRLRDCTSRCSSMSSTASQMSSQDLPHGIAERARQESNSAESPLASSPPQLSNNLSPVRVRGEQSRADTSATMKAVSMSPHVPLSDSDDSLSVRTKDSIEELPSSVSRSPKSSRSAEGRRQTQAEIQPSPTVSPRSARHRLKKKLTVNISGAEFNVERKKPPLSPFTSSGMLRKACIVPQTAPAAVTEFGPTVEDEVREEMNHVRADPDAKAIDRTTRSERGGGKLLGFLGRRINRDKSA